MMRQIGYCFYEGERYQWRNDARPGKHGSWTVYTKEAQVKQADRLARSRKAMTKDERRAEKRKNRCVFYPLPLFLLLLLFLRS